MAAGVLEGARPRAPAPYADRVGTPVLAAVVARLSGWPLLESFRRVNLLATAATVILLALWLGRHVPDPIARLVVLTFFMIEPHSPLRFTFFYPVTVDPVALMWLVTGLLGLDWFLACPRGARAGGVAVLAALGVAFREAVLVVALAMLCVRRHSSLPGGERTIERGRWLPLLVGRALALAWEAVPAGPRRAAGERGRTPARLWFGLLLVLQLVASRVFVPIDGEATPARLGRPAPGAFSQSWLGAYESLWSFMLTREQLIGLAALHATGLLVVWLSLWWAGRRAA